MSVAPVTERRRIGDILLALGFASEEQLVAASTEQERSGQPLGQILVQQGAITRLELASALAEQWSDQSMSISLAPVAKPAPRPVVQHDDDDQYAARLQDAVTDLARRVHATQPEGAVDERVNDLAERIEATVARTQRLEATLATLADSLEGVTGGVEEAFAGLQGGMSGLALDLARIDSTVAEILVDEAGLVDLRAQVSEVQEQVEALAGAAPATADLERQADILGELRTTVAELALRPVGSPEVDARLERLEASLGERLAEVPDAAVVGTLAGRIEATIGGQEDIRASVEALDARIEEIAGLAVRDDGTRARVDDLERRLETGAAALVELRRALTERPEPPSTRKLEKLGDALDSLKRDVASLAQGTSADLLSRDDLAQALEGARDELRRMLPEPDERIEQLVHDLEAVRAHLAQAELAGGQAEQTALTADIRSIESRLASDIVTAAGLEEALIEIRGEIARSALETPRSDESAEALGRLEERLGAVEALSERVAGLAQAVEAAAPHDQASDTEDLRRELESQLEQLARTVDERLAGPPASPTAPFAAPTELEHELERTRMALERVGLHLGEHDRALAEMRGSRAVTQRLDEIAARVEDLAVAGQAVSTGPKGSEGKSYARRSLEPDLEMRALIRRLEDVEEAAHAGREKLMNRFERMASSIDWRLQRLESGDAE